MSDARVRRLVVALVLVFVGLGWVAYEVATGRSMAFDSHVRETIHGYASERLTSIMIFMSWIGKPYVIMPLALSIWALFWFGGMRRGAILFLIALAGEIPIEQTLKFAFHRTRPDAYFSYPLPTSHSFPSGHALSSLIIFGSAAALLAPRLRTTWHKALLWFGATLLIAAIGFSRIYLGVHYPTDVIAGYLAALVWLLVIAIGRYAIG